MMLEVPSRMLPEFTAAVAERIRQDRKHGEQIDVPDYLCFGFTMEEVGEVAKEHFEIELARLRLGDGWEGREAAEEWLYIEIIQAAACFLKWAQVIRQRRERRTEPGPSPLPGMADYLRDGTTAH